MADIDKGCVVTTEVAAEKPEKQIPRRPKPARDDKKIRSLSA